MPSFNNIQNKQIFISRSSTSVSIVLIMRNNQYYVLASKRDNPSLTDNGKWCMPCGYLDYNESLLQASIRETYEETGFDLTDIKLHDFTFYSKEDCPWRVHSQVKLKDNVQNISNWFKFVINFKDEFPILSKKTSESIDSRWIREADIDGYEWAFNHDVIIKKCIKEEWEIKI